MNKFVKRYCIDAMAGMAQGLFASLLIGTIIKTIGQQLVRLAANPFTQFFVDAGNFATDAHVVGAAMAIGIGFAMLDREASENALLQKRLEEDMNLIGGLAEEYIALFYFNIDDGGYKVYSLSNEIKEFANSFLKGKEDGIKAIKQFGTSPFIHPNDRQFFSEFSNELIRNKLKHTKKFSVRFRRISHGFEEWFEMSVLKKENADDRANIVFIGFSPCGQEVKKEQTLQNAFNILSKDIGSYDAVNELLSNISDYYGGTRSYVCEILKTKGTIATTYESLNDAEGISVKHKESPIENITAWIDRIKDGEPIIFDGDDRSMNSKSSLEILSKMNVKKLAFAPMINNGDLVGFVGIDNPTQSFDDLSVLKTISTIIYSEILKRKEGDEEHTTLEKVTNSFVSVFFADLNRDYAHNWKLAQQYRYTQDDLAISKYKTLSHKFNYPKNSEIACIKNYLKLNAKITTTTKVNSIEESSILANIYTALYSEFNARQLDFGEEIPYDTLLSTIERADTRIKNVILDEPELITRIMDCEGTEYSIKDSEKKLENFKVLYNKLTLRNILAGRIKMFDYDLDFKHEFTDAQYK